MTGCCLSRQGVFTYIESDLFTDITVRSQSHWCLVGDYHFSDIIYVPVTTLYVKWYSLCFYIVEVEWHFCKICLHLCKSEWNLVLFTDDFNRMCAKPIGHG